MEVPFGDIIRHLLECRFWPRNHHFPGLATFRKLAA